MSYCTELSSHSITLLILRLYAQWFCDGFTVALQRNIYARMHLATRTSAKQAIQLLHVCVYMNRCGFVGLRQPGEGVGYDQLAVVCSYGFSHEEAGRYLELYKAYENKPPTEIMGKSSTDYLSQVKGFCSPRDQL